LKTPILSVVESKLKLLTANADDYFWHCGLEVETHGRR
jgi:hypothetical protein